jgi:hypothetical protein
VGLIMVVGVGALCSAARFLYRIAEGDDEKNGGMPMKTVMLMVSGSLLETMWAVGAGHLQAPKG